MTALAVIAGLQLLVIVALIALRDRERRQNASLLADFSREAAAERAELLTRIQRPELVPVARPPAQREMPHPNLSKIGTFAPRDDDG